MDVTTPSPKPPGLLEQLTGADLALARTLEALPDAAYAEPSGLARWSRGHVVAHLLLNAEALAAVLVGAARGDAPPMYPSAEQRDTDIDALAPAPPSELRARLRAGTLAFAEAIVRLPEDRLDVLSARSPGSDRTFPARAVLGMRLREVEIHHADLAAGYAHPDWPLPFAAHLISTLTARPGWDQAFTVAPTDLGDTWHSGADGDDPVAAGPVITGSAADLGWWLAGRGSGAGLTSSDGALPRTGTL